MTTAVDQHQRTLNAETAKVEQVETSHPDAEARIRLRKGAAQRRKVVERFAEVVAGLLVDLVAREISDRDGRLEFRTADTRAGDDDRRRRFGRRIAFVHVRGRRYVSFRFDIRRVRWRRECR